jgi:hypothetical protein
MFLLLVFCLSLVQAALAQTPTATGSALPRLVRFGGTLMGPPVDWSNTARRAR